MYRNLRRLAYMALAVSILSACAAEPSRDNPIQRRTIALINELDSFTAVVPDFQPSMAIAAAAVERRAQVGATAGEVCDVISLVEPDIEAQLTLGVEAAGPSGSSTIEALETMLAQFRLIKGDLSCDLLIAAGG